MKPIRLLVINPIWPHPNHSTEAVNVVLFQLIQAFSQQPNIKVGFLKLQRSGTAPPTNQEEEGISSLRAQHVDILPPLTLSFPSSRPKWRKIILPTLADFYYGLTESDKLKTKDIVMSYRPDIIFIPWSEWVTALCADIPVKKYAYYGNPDPKSALARANFDRKHGTLHPLSHFAKRLAAAQLESFHLSQMKKYEFLGDVAANDADYYSNSGHKNASYIQNVWIDRFPNWQEERKRLEQKDPPIIIANIGRLSATANTHGLDILGREFLPAFRQIMGGKPYELHLFGSGDPHPAVANNLKVPEVRLRGFVNDIDTELLRAQIFLCLNNGSAYKVGHTRYLHAWSLGSCVVAHRDAALSMPEIIHMENALLGNSPQEIAELTKMAISDPALRTSLGEWGYATFKEYFTAQKVTPKIIQAMKQYL